MEIHFIEEKELIACINVVIILGMIVGTGYGIFHYYFGRMSWQELHESLSFDKTFENLSDKDEDEPHMPLGLGE